MKGSNFDDIISSIGDPIEIEENKDETKILYYCNQKQFGRNVHHFFAFTLKNNKLRKSKEYLVYSSELEGKRLMSCSDLGFRVAELKDIEVKRDRAQQDRAREEFVKRKKFEQEQEHREGMLKAALKSYADGKDYQATENVMFNVWDEGSRIEMNKNIDIVRLLHVDVMNGTYDKVQEIAERLELQKPANKSSLDYYRDASKVYFARIKEEEQQRFNKTLAEVERNEAAIRNKLKWLVETQSSKELELVSETSKVKKVKLNKEVAYLKSESDKNSFWINALENKRDIEEQERLRNHQNRIVAEKRQEQARQEAYRRSMAESARRQADAESSANYQRALNGLNNQVNSMNQNMQNSINSMNNQLNSNKGSGSNFYHVQPIGNGVYGVQPLGR